MKEELIMNFFFCLGLCIVGIYFVLKKILLNKDWKKVEAVFWLMFTRTVLIYYEKLEINQLSKADRVCLVVTVVYLVVKVSLYFNPKIKIDFTKRIKEKLTPWYIKEELLTDKGTWLCVISLFFIIIIFYNNNAITKWIIILFVFVYTIIRIVYRGGKIRCLHYIKLYEEKIQVNENTEKVCFQILDIAIITLIMGAGIILMLFKAYGEDVLPGIVVYLTAMIVLFLFFTYYSIKKNNIFIKILALLCVSVYSFLIVFVVLGIALTLLSMVTILLKNPNSGTGLEIAKNFLTGLKKIESILILIGYAVSEFEIFFWVVILFSVTLASAYVFVTPSNQLEKLSSAIRVFDIFSVIGSCIQFRITHIIRLKVRNGQFELPNELLDGAPESFIKYIEEFSQNGIADIFFGIAIVYVTGILTANLCLKWRKERNEKACKEILKKILIEGKITDYDRKKYYYFNGDKLRLLCIEKILK